MTHVPEGWKLVPVEPTQEMIDAVRWVASGWVKGTRHAEETYDAMLAASPPQAYRVSGIDKQLRSDSAPTLTPVAPPQADDAWVGESDVTVKVARFIERHPCYDNPRGARYIGASLLARDLYAADLLASPPSTSRAQAIEERACNLFKSIVQTHYIAQAQRREIPVAQIAILTDESVRQFRHALQGQQGGAE